MTKIAFGFLCPLIFCSTIEASAADAWQEDFRRCRVLKQFSQGSVIISAGEKVVELDIQWNDGAGLDSLGVTNISVQISGRRLIAAGREGRIRGAVDVHGK
jgi:hypothetical protein